MKIKILNNSKYKLIKLEFIKSKTFKNYLQKFNFKNNLCQFEFYLKRALLIIFKYHLNKNSKIIFIGIPKKIQKTLKKTKHILLPESYLNNKLTMNNLTMLKYLKNYVNLFIKNNLRKQSKKNLPEYLFVIFSSKTELNIIENTTKLKIPIITFNLEILLNSKHYYKIPGNFDFFKKNNNFFSLLLNSIFKKTK